MDKVLTLAKKNPAEGTADYENLTILSLLIQEYDQKHYSNVEADLINTIKFKMEQQELYPSECKNFHKSDAVPMEFR